MPEWKSWEFTSDGNTPLTAVPHALSSPAAPGDEAATQWDTTVEPVSLARVERVLEGDGYAHGSGEHVVVTDINHTRIQFHREPADAPWLQVEAHLVLSEDDTASVTAPDLTQIANQWNTDHLQPTVFPLQLEGSWVFVLATRFFVGEGLSDRQIHHLIRRGLAVTLQALKELPALIARGAQ